MSYESHSRNFNLIVPLSQLATATGPSFAINRLRVVGLSRRILNKNKLVYCTLFLSLPSLLCLFLSTIPYALFILLSRPFFSPCFFLSLFGFSIALGLFNSASRMYMRLQLFELSASHGSIRQRVVVITSFTETVGLSLCNSTLLHDFVSLRRVN